MRKILLTLLLSGVWFLSTAQTTSTLPSGYTPFANQLFYKIAAGDTTIISGATNKGFHVLQTTQGLRDSLYLYAKKTFLSATSPIFYNPVTGVISSQAASASLSGYVNNSSQFFSGVKTFTASPVIQSSENSYVNVLSGLEASEAGLILKDRTQDKWGFLKYGTSQDLGIFNYVTNSSALNVDIDNNNVTLESLGSELVKSTNGLLSNAEVGVDYQSPVFINVKDYGAVGNGVTNDRAAIRAALTAAGTGNTVYFPNGTYLADSLLIPEGVKLLGASSSTSKLKIVTGSSYLVKLDGENVVDNLYFLGSNPTEVYVQADAVGTERAIIMDDVSDTDNFVIQNSIIVGFDNAAIYANNIGANNNYYGAGLKISNIITEFNYYGLYLDTNAQYSQVVNSIFLKSHTSAEVRGGNNQFANCGFNGGVNGYKLLQGGNDGHGAVVNSTFNHNTGFAILVDSVLLGQKFSNIHVYEGVVQVDRSIGIQFTNSHFSTDSIVLGRSQAGTITNSTFDNNNGGGIIRNFGGDDGFYLNGNRYLDTTANSVPLIYSYINDPVRLYAQTLGAKTPGTAGQVLVSTGSSIAPVWSSTPTLTNYLPLTGGTLTGDLTGTNITSTATLVANTVNVIGLQTNNTANSAADALRYNQIIAATNAYNSNAAAGTMYQFKFNSAGDLVNAGGISVNKENTTSGDFASEVGLYNRANGGNMTKVFKVSSAGIPQIPLMTGSSTEMVTISTDGTLGRTAIPSGGGGGAVATIGVASANGLGGTSNGDTTNPTLTLTTSVSGMVKGNGTAFSAATGDTDYQVPLTFSTGLTRSTNTITVNQAFTPTWTGIHTFSNDIVANAQINMSGQSAARIRSGSTDFGIQNNAASANNLLILDNGNTTVRGSIAPLGGITFASLAAGRIIGGSTDFAINNNANTLNNLVILDNGNTTVRGTLGASNLSGTNTGDQTSVTGNAGTATALQTARTIQGVSFDGTSNINPINGIGFVKATGTTLSYDNSTYLTSAVTSIASGSGMSFSTITGTGTIAMGTPSSITSSSTNSTSTTSHTHAITSLPSATTATTQSAGDNSTKVATTAYVDGALSNRTDGGTYTPTSFNGANTASSTAYNCTWTYIDGVVHVQGSIDIDPTSSGVDTYVGISLAPGYGSAFSSPTDLNGLGVSVGSGQAVIKADTTNDRADVYLYPSSASSQTYYFSFSYYVNSL